MEETSKKPISRLRRRWLLSAAGLVFALGLICVAAITTVFAASRYEHLESNLRLQSGMTAEIFSNYTGESQDISIQKCIDYVKSYDGKNGVGLQFVETKTGTITQSQNCLSEWLSLTYEVSEAGESRGTTRFMGKDPDFGKRIMAVSSPLIYSNGEVIGVIRCVASLKEADRSVVYFTGACLLILLVVVMILVISSNYFINSVMSQVREINEKAMKIANGSYGAKIQTKYDDEIGELASTINELSFKISENEKVQTEFISSLSHELRTPLTAITGWSETLLAGTELSRENRRGMRIIWREAKRLTEMVVDLLDFTRMQGGRMTLNIDDADIRAEFEDTVYMYSSRLAQEGINLNYLDNDDDIPEIPCDAKRMRQVFLNILDNAAKHGEGKDIEATMNLEGDMVVVRIRDYGPGIPEDEIPLVKKKFFKGSSKARGSGIGLAVSDEIVEMHGGTLTLENAEGGGTLVTISLPISQ